MLHTLLFHSLFDIQCFPFFAYNEIIAIAGFVLMLDKNQKH